MRARPHKGVAAAVVIILLALVAIGALAGGVLRGLAWGAAGIFVLAVVVSAAAAFADYLVAEVGPRGRDGAGGALEAKLRKLEARQRADTAEIERAIEQVAAAQLASAKELEDRLDRVAARLAADRESSAPRA